MKKTIVLTYLLLITANTLISQVSDASWEYLGREFPNGTFNTFNSKVKGSPYIEKSYQKIKFLNQKDGQFSGKYNAYHGVIEVLTSSGKKYFSPSKEHPYSVHFLGSNKTYKAYSINKEKSVFFRILLSKKKATLLTRDIIFLTKEVLPKSGYDKYKAPTFKRKKNKYYIYYNDQNSVVKIPRKKSKFYKIFGINSSKIKKYIKKEKLNIKKENDLIKIFNFYNTL